MDNFKGVSNRWTGFSTGTWDWNVGLDYLTGMWDWTAGLECATGIMVQYFNFFKFFIFFLQFFNGFIH